MKDKNLIIFFVILLFVSIVVVLYKDKLASFLHKKVKGNDASKADGVTGSDNGNDLDLILNKGDTGELVELLQSFLNLVLVSSDRHAKDFGISASCIDGNGDLEVDGSFGNCTETILKSLTGVSSISINKLNSMFPFLSVQNGNVVTGGDTTNFYYDKVDDFTDALDAGLDYFGSGAGGTW